MKNIKNYKKIINLIDEEEEKHVKRKEVAKRKIEEKEEKHVENQQATHLTFIKKV